MQSATVGMQPDKSKADHADDVTSFLAFPISYVVGLLRDFSSVYLLDFDQSHTVRLLSYMKKTRAELIQTFQVGVELHGTYLDIQNSLQGCEYQMSIPDS